MARLITTTALDNQFSVTALDTTDMVNEMIKIHNLSPLSAATAGRALTIATYMCSQFKSEEDKLSVTINGNGTAGHIVVCGNGKMEMRASIENTCGDLPLKANGKLDVGSFVGKTGKITVVKDIGLKEPYVGTCNLISGELGEDFTAYFAYSEQVPTAIAVGVKIGTDLKCEGAGAVILQALPGADDEHIDKAEKIMNGLNNISTLVKEKPLEDVLIDSFGMDNLFYKEAKPVYKCLCSKEYIEKMLITLGFDELYDMIEKDGKIEVNCQFCRKTYDFYKEDINRLKEENGKTQNEPTE